MRHKAHSLNLLQPHKQTYQEEGSTIARIANTEAEEEHIEGCKVPREVHCAILGHCIEVADELKRFGKPAVLEHHGGVVLHCGFLLGVDNIRLAIQQSIHSLLVCHRSPALQHNESALGLGLATVANLAELESIGKACTVGGHEVGTRNAPTQHLHPLVQLLI